MRRKLCDRSTTHIAATYGFEKSTHIHALVMAPLDGPTLTDHIGQGQIPVSGAEGTALFHESATQAYGLTHITSSGIHTQEL